ncbi:MAG TPA: hypothetical protein VMV05_07020 [bacterium]|nr:hypothetical protein [bacterium]
MVLVGVARVLADEANVDWISLRAAYTHYTKDPNEENAENVRSFLPYKPISAVSGGVRRSQKETEEFIRKHLITLESQVFRGQRSAIRLAYHFYMISDTGKFTESLNVILGNLICRNPRLFLQELKGNHRFAPSMTDLLMSYGSDYKSNEKRQHAEFHKRLAALRKVQDWELQDIRDECIEFMEQNPKPSEVLN